MTIILFLLLYIMRVRAAHTGTNQVPLVSRAAHTEKKYIVLTQKVTV